MNIHTKIKTTKTIYPQIYAYVLPKYEFNEGWIKIGYTERQNVEDRIREQTHTAGITYSLLWKGPACFFDGSGWFSDKQLHAFLRRFKNIEQRSGTEWFHYNGTPEKALDDYEEFRGKNLNQVSRKLEYQLRAEQQAAVDATLRYMETHPSGEFLWNAKPRFGKTLTTYDLARCMGAQNVLIVTNRPAIANSWFDDFEKFIAWQTDYRFVSTTDSLRERPVFTREQYLEAPSRCITFISLQDLKGAKCFGGWYDKLRWVKDLTWDLLVIDEAHEGVDTFKTDVAFKQITRKFTLHLSGTPFKAIASGDFSQEQIYNWTYADEQDAKAAWPEDCERSNPYEGMPRLNLFSYQMSPMITGQINQGAEIDGQEMDYAFDLNEFFATNTAGAFLHEDEVRKWLDTLTHNKKYPFSTPELRAELKHTFWILNRVASAKALATLLREHPTFENYEIILAAGDGKTGDDSDEISQKSLDRVREAIRTHTKTITLSVGQLTTGVTIPEWTGVLMLSNMKSPSLYMQAAFRAQNPWSYEIDGNKFRKQNAYVFDFAPERTLILYDEFANNLNRQTADGGGTTDDRETNIRKLLNFFPVIAEDTEGKMVELDVGQVLTIPRAIKAQEVVRRGFMSNFLFQNISGIFASTEAREILEQLHPVASAKVSAPIDTQNVTVDAKGTAVVSPEIVIAETEARFGNKIYEAITGASSSEFETVFVNATLDTAKELAKDHAVTGTQAEQVVKRNGAILTREVELVKAQAEIQQKEVETEYKREVAEAQNDPRATADAKVRFEAQKQAIAENLQTAIAETVAQKTEELLPKITEEILHRGEEKKKNVVENDVRDRLRGFARTIPSFLMAYGTRSTTLANFDQNIKDAVFHEVTGITLDQFRILRDTYNFFDSVVFDQSIQEFLRKKEELGNYFEATQTEDIFDYIPLQRTNQIYTPKKVVRLLLDKLEEENPNLFTDPNRTFADLYVKSGLYLAEIVRRLFAGLKTTIPDDNSRLKHILEHQIYGFAPSEIIYLVAKSLLFGNSEETCNTHLQCWDLTETAKKGDKLDTKFDIVVGTPRFQDESVGDNTRNNPIYYLFYELAESVAPVYCLISPARFLANQGATPKEWNKKMLSDEHLNIEFFNAKSVEVFPNTDIKGGVVVIYRDSRKNFGSIDTFIPYNELRSIYHKVKAVSSENIGHFVYSPDSYRFADELFKENPQLIGRTDASHAKAVATVVFERYPEIFFEAKPEDGEDYVQIYGRLNGERIYRFVKRKYLASHPNLDKWKVFIPGSNGTGAMGEVLSTPVIGQPSVGHNQTFVSLGKFDTELEGTALLNYIKTKLVRALLGIMKTTQHNQSQNTWSKIPLQDFTPQSDIDWTQSIPDIDRQLYAKYGLDAKEIAFIEEKVRAME